MFCDTFYNRNIDFSIVDQLDMDHVYDVVSDSVHKAGPLC